MKKIIMLALVLATVTGCAGVATMNQDFSMSGNAEGIRAYNDGIIGMARTSKESAESPNEYMAQRNFQENEITKRASKPNFLQGLFGTSGGSTAK